MVSKALVAASTKPVILSILAGGEIYGYQIIHSTIEISGGILQWSEGTIYPVLHRLEKDGFIRSQWKMSDNGRRRGHGHRVGHGRLSGCARRFGQSGQLTARRIGCNGRLLTS